MLWLFNTVGLLDLIYANIATFKDHVDLVGLKPHGETIRLMMAADVLLLISFAADERTRDKIITGKIFELI